MKLFKNLKRHTKAMLAVAVVGVAALGLGVATQTNLLGNKAYADTSCIHKTDGINVNNSNSNATVKLDAGCGLHHLQMKSYYAPSASGAPHDQQVRFDEGAIQAVRPSDGPVKLGVQTPDGDASCFYQVDIVDLGANNNNTVLYSKTGGSHDCTHPVFACTGLTATPGAVDQNTGNQIYTFTAKARVNYGTIVKYTFDYDDGTVQAIHSNSTSVTTAPRSYAPRNTSYNPTVVVTVKDNDGDLHTTTAADCTTSFIVQPPEKLTCDQLTATPGSIDQTTGNQTYSFAATASAQRTTITSYVFDFDDGHSQTVSTNATTANASHTYGPGEYDAMVTVFSTNNHQATSPACKVHLNVNQPPRLSCDELNATPGAIDQSTGNQAYGFRASASAQNTTITSYVFSFGDGSADQTVTTSASNASASHTYTPGEHDAHVTVYAGSKQATSDACKVHITVRQPESQLTCENLTATPGDIDQATGNQAYSFTATASAQNTTITSYVFSFGDGSADQTVNTNATTANASHTYAPGDHQARVTVKSADGKSVTSDNCAKNIHVAPPSSSLVCSALAVTPGDVDSSGNQSFTLSASASKTNATITGYTFSFGDGSADTTVNSADVTASTTHTYAAGGSYQASVTVLGKDNNGNTIQNTNANCQKTVQPNVQTPGVTITKVVNGQKSILTSVGTQFTYTLKVTNNGQQDLTNVVVTDTPETGVTLQSADQGTISGNTWTFTIPALAKGDSQTFNITAVVPNYLAGTINNTACVNAPEVNPEHPDQTDSCDSATVSVSTPPTPPPTTPKVLGVTTLVNTGAGSVIGIAATVSILGMLAHRFYLGRKLSN